jgi:hypothetical protein
VLSPTAPSTGDDRGSAALAVVVLMIVTLLALTAVSAGIRGLESSRRESASGQAAAAAELALADAVAQIVAGAPGAFTGSGAGGGATYAYSAVATGPDAWVVRAEATLGGVSRAFEATVQRQAEHPFSLFVVDSATIRNNTGVIDGRFGTNGAVTVTGPAPGSTQELYRPDASCVGCTNAIDRDGPFPVPDTTTPAGSVQACPPGGVFTGTVDGGGGVPHVCDDPGTPVSFTGTVVVRNGPLVVHLADSVDLSLAASDVNLAGPAADVRITAAGAGRLDLGGARVHGLLLAPQRPVVVTGASVVGTLVVADLDLPRAGRLDVVADASVTDVGEGAWTVSPLRSVAIS